MAQLQSPALSAWRMACIAMTLRHVYAQVPASDPDDLVFPILVDRLRRSSEG